MISPPNYAKDALEYIDGVMNKSITTGRLARLSVERHVNDLAHAHERGFYFDRDIAYRALAFFPTVLRHSVGEWDGESFWLTPWQAFCTYVIFGWRKIDDKLRRFRKAHLSVARKNGKTTWAAGMMLYAMYADTPLEASAQGFCAAIKEDQAKNLYEEAVRMINRSSSLSRVTKIRKSPNRVLIRNDSFIRMIGTESKGLHGSNPHVIVRDELHEWRERHREALEAMATGGASRRQQLEITITTAGDHSSQIWIEEDEYATKAAETIVTGKVFDDSYFSYVCRLDKDDDPYEEANWPKANPNYGVSVKPEYLRQQALEAKNKPSAANAFKRFHCNIQVSPNDAAISPEVWTENAIPTTFKAGDSCHGGIDLGRTNDWAAAAFVFPVYEEVENGQFRANHYEAWCRCWTCKNGRFNVDQEPFRQWIKDGLLACCDGDIIDFAEIESEVVRMSQLYAINSIAYDPRHANEFAQRLKDIHGINVFPFTQSHTFYNEPMRKLIDITLPQKQFWHGGDPVLAWQAGNLTIHKRPGSGLIMPDKSLSGNKIDGMVATLMAFSEVLFAEKQSWYNASHDLEVA